MDLDNFLEPEVALAAVVTAAIFSPRTRRILRRGLVYGTAGVLIAGEAITSAAKNVGQGAQQMRFPSDGLGETEKPSDETKKPSAETEKPSDETKKPSAETEKPSGAREPKKPTTDKAGERK